ncbi:TIGR03086 family metal-binding protein [Pedococcus sp. KACC 23699]|uniref:TIGR03086 family metal-binding protein n=1 Tax=Pedococcus sp. KACC 23699 TaxID=3149228 RepID=A0AAU7JQQ7_9MICO
MDTTRDDLATLDRGLTQLSTLVEAVQPSDLERQTPCTDWTVRELLGHVVQGPANFAASVRGESPDWSAAAELPQDWSATFRSNADDLRAAWDQNPDAPGGPGFQVAELAVHSWDLATALGKDAAELDPEVAEVAYATMSQALTPERRGAAFKPEQEPAGDAGPYERLAAFAGRSI